MATIDRLLLLLILTVVPSCTESQPHSACDKLWREKDVQTCLDSIRKRAEDPSAFWFGRGYNSSCHSQGEHMADCYNPRAHSVDSLVSRLSPSGQLDLRSLNRFMEVTYQVSAGKYRACENEFKYDFEKELTLDPLSLSVVTPYELRALPKTWWPGGKKELYTLVFYDAGYFRVKGLYINIPGSSVAKGEVMVEYEGPLNPTRNENPYVFLVFNQSAPVAIDAKWSEQLADRNTDMDLEDFIKQNALQGPVALNWVRVSGDPYAAEITRTRGYMNTCAHFVSDALKKKNLQFIPNMTYSGQPLPLTVYVNVTFEAVSTSVNSCCSVFRYPARTFSLNPLGDAAVLPAHTHSDVIVYVTLSMATAFPDTQRDFKDKLLTLVMADPNVPFPEFGNERLPFLHWLVANIRGADVAAGDVVQGYMGPAPPDRNHHYYYYLVFQQPGRLEPSRLDYSAANCSWAFRGRCRYDVSALAAEQNLKLLGVTWMRATFDEFVREVYVTAGLLPRCVACGGVPGYAVPCSSPAGRPLSCVSALYFLSLAVALTGNFLK